MSESFHESEIKITEAQSRVSFLWRILYRKANRPEITYATRYAKDDQSRNCELDADAIRPIKLKVIRCLYKKPACNVASSMLSLGKRERGRGAKRDGGVRGSGTGTRRRNIPVAIKDRICGRNSTTLRRLATGASPLSRLTMPQKRGPFEQGVS